MFNFRNDARSISIWKPRDRKLFSFNYVLSTIRESFQRMDFVNNKRSPAQIIPRQDLTSFSLLALDHRLLGSMGRTIHLPGLPTAIAIDYREEGII